MVDRGFFISLQKIIAKGLLFLNGSRINTTNQIVGYG